MRVQKNNTLELRIKSFDLHTDVESWLKSIEPPLNYFVLNPDQFTKTSSSNAGAQVYHEFKRRRFWYLDTLHKDNRHYEVFDHFGNHVSEADLKGNMIPNSKDDKKKFKL